MTYQMHVTGKITATVSRVISGETREECLMKAGTLMATDASPLLGDSAVLNVNAPHEILDDGMTIELDGQEFIEVHDDIAEVAVVHEISEALLSGVSTT